MSEPKHDCDWILKAMVAVAASDGHLDTREIGLIQQIYEACKGCKLDAGAIARASDANAQGNIKEEFANAAPRLGDSTKEEIIRSAYLVLLADNRIMGEERKQLLDIAVALKIPEIHFGAILEDLTNSLENKA